MANRVTHYQLEVEVDPAARQLRVAADLTLANTEPLDLYLGPEAEIEDLVAPQATATTRVSIAGYHPWQLHYRTPPGHVHLRYCFRSHAITTLPQHMEEAAGYLDSGAAWYPVVLGPNVFPFVPAPFQVRVYVPPGYRTYLPAQQHGDTWTMHERRAIALIYGRYRVAQFPEGVAWLLDDRDERLWRVRDLVRMGRESQAFYQTILGPAEQGLFVLIEARSAPGREIFGLGFPNAQLLAEQLFEQPEHYLHYFIAHECAHAWWGAGGQVEPQDDAWGFLVEGMADYWALRAVEAQGERSEAGRVLDRYVAEAEPGLLAGVSPSAPSYTAVAYKKGALVHVALDHLLGRTVFDRALRRMVGERASPTIADFQLRLERESGRELAPFFRQFVYGSDLPRVAPMSACGNHRSFSTPGMP